MAKHGKKNRMGRYIRGQIDDELAFGSLASKDLSSSDLDEVVQERTLITSVVLTHTMDNLTPTANVGPIMCGVAHGDYTTAEIEAFIENAGSWDEGNLTSQEIGRRKIRIVGIFDGVGSAADSTVLNDGKPIKTKLNWILTQGETIQQWVYNLGSAAVATTAPNYHIQGHANLFPK